LYGRSAGSALPVPLSVPSSGVIVVGRSEATKAVKAIGLTIPQSLLLRADEVVR